MGKEVITKHQAITFIGVFLMSSNLVLPTGVKAGTDLWIAIIVAGIISFFILTIYARILSIVPEKDFFETMEIIFGKYIGKFLSLILIWYAFHLGALVLRNFGEYLNVIGITDTPKIIPMAFLQILCIWIVKEGVGVLGRWSKFAIRFFLGLVILTIGFMSNQWDLKNLLPIFYNGVGPIFDGVLHVISLPFAETVVFLLIFSTISKGKRATYQVFWYGLLIGVLVTLVTSVNELLTLGIDAYSHSKFPSHNAISRLYVGDFLQRLEIIPAVGLLGGGFIKVSACLIATTRGLAHMLNLKDYRFLVTPIGLLMLNLSMLVYEDILELIPWASDVWPFYSLVFQVFLPVCIWLAGEIYLFRSKKSQPGSS